MLVGVLGAAYLLFGDRAAAILLGVLFVGCLGQAILYLQLGIEDFYVFLIPAFLSFGLCISVGLGAVLRWTESLAVGFAIRTAILVALSVLMLAVPLVGVREAYAAHDRSTTLGDAGRSRSWLRNAKRDATILHHRSPLWYMVLVERRRRDLTLIDPFCTSWDRHTDIVWPDQIDAAEAANRSAPTTPRASRPPAKPPGKVPSTFSPTPAAT